ERNESANSCCFATMQASLWIKYSLIAILQRTNLPIRQSNQIDGRFFLYDDVEQKSFELSSYAFHAARRRWMDQYADPQALYLKYSLVVLLTIFTHDDQCNHFQT